MNDLPPQDTLELEVADFGPIVEAKIDLRPMTVFVGPSNTGKSYLAILIYALHRYFSGGERPSRRHFFRGYPMFRSHGAKVRQATIDALIEWATQTFAGRQKPSGTKHIVLPGVVSDAIRSEFGAQGNAFGNEIVRCFGIDTIGALLRKGSKGGAHIVLRRRLNGSAPFEYGLTIKGQETEFKTTIPKGTPMRIDVRDADRQIEYLQQVVENMILKADRKDESEMVWAWQRLMGVFAEQALPHLVGPLRLPAFYLPADRTGVMHAHSVVVSALIESASMTGLRPAARTPMLSGVLADFLEQMINLDHPRLHKVRHDRAEKIETAILGGSVRIDRSETIGYPRFTYRPQGWGDDLPLMNASSMVSELAPVVLYLRHMVRPGNVLIVEEPESHLHPAMQVEFTRQIAALIQSGIRVIVTTHSEWVLEELANLVRRSKIAAGDVALRHDQVGVWLFEPKRRPRGSVVKEISLDDSGIYPSSFDEVAIALHNSWAEISSRIGEAE